MNKVINIKETQLKLIGDTRIVVSNYKNVLDILKSKVVLLHYIIEGEDLLIKKMDDYEIEITGIIKKISIY